MEFPEDLRYTKEHEWVRIEGGRYASASPTSPRTRSATSCTSICPSVGTKVRADRPLGEVESTKSVSDVFSPVDGTVVERNPLLEDRPELVNEQPYGDGWLVVIEPVEASRADERLDGPRRIGSQSCNDRD